MSSSSTIGFGKVYFGVSFRALLRRIQSGDRSAVNWVQWCWSQYSSPRSRWVRNHQIKKLVEYLLANGVSLDGCKVDEYLTPRGHDDSDDSSSDGQIGEDLARIAASLAALSLKVSRSNRGSSSRKVK